MSDVTYSVTDTVSLFRLFDTLRIPTRVAAPIVNKVKQWERSSGPEWTVKRLKGLKTLYLQHYAGNTSFRLETESGISFHSDGTPKGPFRALWTMGYAYRTVNKVMAVLQMHTTYLHLREPLADQLDTFCLAVESPKPAQKLPEWFIRKEILWLLQSAWKEARFDSVAAWTSTTKRVLHFERSKGLSKIPENVLTVNDHTADLLLAIGPWLERFNVRQVFVAAGINEVKFWKWTTSDIIEAEKARLDRAAPMLTMIQSSHADPIVGNIGFIQERGLKLRAVANPFRFIQVALSRLKNYLSELQRTSLPWDCTFDQGRGVRWAQRKLRSGIRLHAYDLSNASDTIPLEDQISFLKHTAPHNDVQYIGSMELLELVARGRWVIDYPNEEYGFLRWTKGQPLGIGPSFGLFSVVHGLRLDQLSCELGLEDSFTVLGDDVIVTESLSEAYVQLLDIWGCEYSKEKSITSDSISEFASKVMTTDRIHKTWKFPRSRRLFSTRDPLDILRRYGKRAIKLVPCEFRDTVRAMAEVPTARGGLGIVWTPSERTLPDPVSFVDVFAPILRDKIPDVITPRFVKNKGGYDSVVMSSRDYVERKQDLVVAYNTIVLTNSDATPGERVAKNATMFADVGDAKTVHHPFAREESYLEHCLSNHSRRVTPLEGQWLILHANANQNNPNFNLDVLGWTSHLTGLRAREPFVLEDRPSETTMKVLFRKAFLWLESVIDGVRLTSFLRKAGKLWLIKGALMRRHK